VKNFNIREHKYVQLRMGAYSPRITPSGAFRILAPEAPHSDKSPAPAETATYNWRRNSFTKELGSQVADSGLTG